jgi:hypothetical protein
MLELSILILAALLLKCFLLVRELRDLLKREVKREPEFVLYPVFQLEDLQKQQAAMETSFRKAVEVRETRTEYPYPDVLDIGYRDILQSLFEAEQHNRDDVREFRFMIESNFRVRSGLSSIEELANQREKLFGLDQILARQTEARKWVESLYKNPTP